MAASAEGAPSSPAVADVEAAANERTHTQRWATRLKAWTKMYWFLEVMAVLLVAARLYPDLGRKGGVLHAELWAKYVLISVIFLISGLSIDTRKLTLTARRLHLHLRRCAACQRRH